MSWVCPDCSKEFKRPGNHRFQHNPEMAKVFGEKIAISNSGKIPWNKGLDKETDSRIKSHPNYFIQGHTQAEKDLISASLKAQWEDPEIRTKRINSNIGKHDWSQERKDAQSEIMKERRATDPRSKEWSRLGGLGTRKHFQDLGYVRDDDDAYPYEWTKELKRVIKNRDNWTCQDCGIKQNDLTKSGKWLLVHHLDGNKKNLGKDNLITLCRPCYTYFHHVDNGHKVIREEKALKKCEICQKEFQKLGVHKANAHTILALGCLICG